MRLKNEILATEDMISKSAFQHGTQYPRLLWSFSRAPEGLSRPDRATHPRWMNTKCGGFVKRENQVSPKWSDVLRPFGLMAERQSYSYDYRSGGCFQFMAALRVLSICGQTGGRAANN